MKTEKILIVDDDEGQRNAIQFLLKKQNYLVIAANNGISGLRVLNEYDDIHVLIVDLAMLELSGVELLEAIKDRRQPLRRIVLTAHDIELTHTDADKLNVFSYLNKPISKNTLLFAVKSAFNDLHREALERELSIAKQWEVLGQITADFVHLVGNKVGIIPNYIESIREELKSVPREVSTKLDNIKEIVAQIIALKNELLKPSNKAKVEKVDVNQIIKSTISLMQLPGDISVATDYDLVAADVFCNALDLKKVIEIIIQNAIDAMQDSKRKELSISTSRGENETVQIVIKDTGCGIADENKDKIFRPFFTTKEKANYGIGLFSARNTLAHFDGTIKYQKNKEGETCFIINLPLGEE